MILRHFVGETVPEVADSMPMSQSTVYRHLERPLSLAFARAGVRRTQWLEGVLLFLHLHCCLSLDQPSRKR